MKKIKLLLTTISILIFQALQVMADETSADVSSVTAPINNATSLFCTVLSAIGGFVVIWGIYHLSTGIRAEDTATQHKGIVTIASGAVLVAVKIVQQVIMG